MYMDYFTVTLLILIVLYLVIITKKRGITNTMVKRNSLKLDKISEGINKQNKLMKTLIKVLGDSED